MSSINTTDISLGREIQFTSLLDIGAHVGNFTKAVLSKFPSARCLMIEANEFCRPYLEEVGVPFEIAVLGARDNVVAIYWMDREDLLSTGNSCYRELTDNFAGDRAIGSVRATRTLDGIVNGSEFEFIKMDTQGSELSVLMGGEKTLSKAQWVLMEVANESYNQGAPLRPDVMRFMGLHGFLAKYEFNTDELKQKDVLFIRKNS